MIQLEVLSGKTAGQIHEVRRFPVRIGRSGQNGLRFEEDGVWEEHFQVTVDPQQGFVLNVQPEALLTVNQAPVQSARLGNGDIIQAGSVRLMFRLAETRQRSLRLREWLVWAIVLGVSLSQVALIYILLR